MLGRANFRYVLFALVALALLVVFLVPHTPIPQHTSDFVKSWLGHNDEESKPIFNPDKWFFQADLELPEVNYNFEELHDLPPHNYHGPGHETYATLYASRNASMNDPYFSAAQQIVYRLLWRQRTASKKHPVTVFVTQYVDQSQRDVFTAAGAIVRELALRPFEPEMAGVPARLQDMFSKLEMWRQLDFSRIAYLDCDAIPIEHIDDIFGFAKEKACRFDLLPGVDRVFGPDICKYAFASHMEGRDGVNAGVMIFKPEQAMYRRLVRESFNKTGWDTGYLEQALLSHLYHVDGPFPPSEIELGYNSFPDYKEQNITIKILHDKMWSHYYDDREWVKDDWNTTWYEMKDFYESEKFIKLRLADQKTMRDKIKQLSAKLGHV